MSVALDPRDLPEGPRRVYIGPSVFDVGYPGEPANTVAFGGTMPAGYRLLGYTARDALQIGSPSAERTAIYSGEARGQIRSVMGEVLETVTFRILSRTLQNIKDMAGRGELSQIAAGSGTPGEIRYTLTDTENDLLCLLIEGPGTQGRVFRAHYPAGAFSINEAIGLGIGADAAQSGIAVTFTNEGGPDNPPAWWEILPAL